MKKTKNLVYFLAALAGFSWLLRQEIIARPQALAVSEACQLQGDGERYVNAAAKQESEDLFVSCGGFL